MRYTIKDVADVAGVSIATVSRVINNKDRVKDSTKRKILAAIDKLNYQPDIIARTMIVKSTKTVGLLVPTLSNEYWALLAEVIQDELWKYGYTLMLCAGFHNDEDSKDGTYLKAFLDRRMDGIIVGSLKCSKKEESDFLEAAKESGIPVISFEQRLSGSYMVTGDDLQGATMAVEHLIKLGHKKIAYIHGAGGRRDERELGYMNAHFINNITVENDLIKRIEYGIDEGYKAANDLIEDKVDFTALFCWNDLIAFGAIKAFNNRGFKVPHDVAVVGYDNISMAKVYNPALTTVAQPISEMGSNIVTLLLEAIDKKDVDRTYKIIKLPMKLVVRESCGAKSKCSLPI